MAKGKSIACDHCNCEVELGNYIYYHHENFYCERCMDIVLEEEKEEAEKTVREILQEWGEI